MEGFLDDIGSSDTRRKKQGLDNLLAEVRKNNGHFHISNLSKFFITINSRLAENDFNIVSSSLHLMQEIIPNFGPDLESNFNNLLPNLVALLSETSSGLGKLSMNVISLYIKTTRNLETVMSNLVKYGLSSEDWKTRHRSLLAIIPFISLDLSFTMNVQEMKRILERILGMIKDASAQVCESAKEVAARLKDLTYDFPAVFSKLSPVYQQLFQEFCDQSKVNLLRSSIQKVSDIPGKSILEDIEKPKTFVFQNAGLAAVSSGISLTYLESNKNSLIFGFVPQALMQQLEDHENWRQRVAAVQEIENLVLSLENSHEIMPYMAIFVRFLSKLLEDSNFKISISVLNILKEIVCFPNVAQQSNIMQVLPFCIKKLGDNKISVRQSAFKVLIALFRSSTNRTIVNVIVPQLTEAFTDPNWHIREEVVIVLLGSMLDSADYDYFSIVPDLAKLLDDQKTKIRYVTTEALAFISTKNTQKVVEILRPIVDESALNSLNQRFQQKAQAVLTEDYVEFPRTMPSSAPISSPYITSSSFPSSFNKTIDIYTLPKSNNETFTPSTLNSSVSPMTNSKVKRMRPSSESNFTVEMDLSQQKKPPIFKNEKIAPKQSYQARFILKQEKNGPKPRDESFVKIAHSSPYMQKPRPEVQNEDQPTYLAAEDLRKISNPEEALKKCTLAGSLENWADQFEAMNVLRRLVKHHSHVFASQVSLHNLCLDLIKWADSLRSSLSKNALIVISEMCESLRKTLDSEINDLLKILIKKSIDTNIFISEQADVAIHSMCRYSNEVKIALSLLAIAQNNKNPVAKAKIAWAFSLVFKRFESNITKLKDPDKVLGILAEFLSDASFDVRNNSKEAVMAFSDAIQNDYEFERLVMRSVNEASRKKIMESVQGKPTNRFPSPVKKSAYRELRSRNLGDKDSRNPRAHSTGLAQDLPELEIIGKIATDMQSNEWKTRYACIKDLENLVLEHSEVIKPSSKLLNVIDLFCKGLTDQNLKVNIHTLNSLAKIIPVIGKTLEPHLTILMNALLPGLGSANSSIRDIAKDVCKVIVKNLEPCSIIVPLVSSLSSGNNRSKVTIIMMIVDIVPKVYDKKPGIVVKNVIPAVCKLAESAKVEIKEEISKLVKKMYYVMNSEFFDHLPAGKSQKILEILNDEY